MKIEIDSHTTYHITSQAKREKILAIINKPDLAELAENNWKNFIDEYTKEPKKILFIKSLKESANCSLKEAKDAVEENANFMNYYNKYYELVALVRGY